MQIRDSHLDKVVKCTQAVLSSLPRLSSVHLVSRRSAQFAAVVKRSTLQTRPRQTYKRSSESSAPGALNERPTPGHTTDNIS